MKTKVILLVIILLVCGYLGYQYIYQDHRNIKEEVAAFKIDSDELYVEFTTNAKSAESKYINKTIEVSGNITKIEPQALIIDHKIYCQFTESIPLDISENQPVILKGRFIGYDDLLEYINLDQCTLKNSL